MSTVPDATTATTSALRAGEPEWLLRFRTPHLLTARPVVGDPDWALVVSNDIDEATGRLVNTATGERGETLPFGAGYEVAVSPDRRWVIKLDDDGGSEVGHLHAYPVTGGDSIDLTPDRDAYVVRGMEFSADGSVLLLSLVDEEGYHLVRVPAGSWVEAETIASTPNEAWFGRISADGRLASFDSTEQNPGVRRTAVTVFDAAAAAAGTGTGFEPIATADDLPSGPVRAVRFSGVPGDQRLLLSTERSGYARPAIWSPLTGDRVDFELVKLAGEVVPLDWHAASGRLLAVQIEDGLHRLLVIDEGTHEAEVVREGTGSYANPDVASSMHTYSTSYFGSGGDVIAFEESWHVPPHLVRLSRDWTPDVVIPPADVPEGVPLHSEMVASTDGTLVQLWWATPTAPGPVKGTVLGVHGGPNLVTNDGYDPSAQAWLAEGYAYASLNYRGSVTFGRDFREGFWGSAGDREIEDVTAALDWLGTRGLADPASTFITGPSYGGHLTLLSLGRLPERFAGGFAIVAMADWAAAFADMNPAVRLVWLNFLRNTDGDLDAAIAHFSPIGYVGSVRGSVWLSQGSRDTRTPPAQAQAYVDALRAHGGDALIEWYDAGHEPVGLRGEEEAQVRMLELAELALAGTKWSA
ncbi:prolyl oligopeptidase family serine peptidase [Rathayibacter sp. VKM Ac-2760]|uniref:alpha/beta hydrolase family protein n=1 Tax=Rathayibacter sp. VKM Ac-2760 TaxID=2609253 RepID=UPI0013168C9A|nr:prolyl oligopeptidase family serine peptidase [Rathayibacter sp. VKM Ac-2760]QHC61196.1 prolyl oligopeptidase family serine peptidase [Rathayibacter sp. VKM Ac-2760]